jgi:hypothetical protein
MAAVGRDGPLRCYRPRSWRQRVQVGGEAGSLPPTQFVIPAKVRGEFPTAKLFIALVLVVRGQEVSSGPRVTVSSPWPELDVFPLRGRAWVDYPVLSFA